MLLTGPKDKERDESQGVVIVMLEGEMNGRIIETILVGNKIL